MSTNDQMMSDLARAGKISPLSSLNSAFLE